MLMNDQDLSRRTGEHDDGTFPGNLSQRPGFEADEYEAQPSYHDTHLDVILLTNCGRTVQMLCAVSSKWRSAELAQEENW